MVGSLTLGLLGHAPLKFYVLRRPGRKWDMNSVTITESRN